MGHRNKTIQSVIDFIHGEERKEGRGRTENSEDKCLDIQFVVNRELEQSSLEKIDMYQIKEG